MHLLVVWHLVNLQDARCNNKDNNNGYSALGLVWQEPEPYQSGDRYGYATQHPGQVLRGSLPLLSPLINYVNWNMGHDIRLKETAEEKNSESTVVSSNDENSYDLDGISRVPHIWANRVQKTQVSLHPSFLIGCHLFIVQLVKSLKPSRCTARHRTSQTMTALTHIHKAQLHFSHMFLTTMYRLMVTTYNSRPTPASLWMSQPVFQSTTVLICRAS